MIKGAIKKIGILNHTKSLKNLAYFSKFKFKRPQNQSDIDIQKQNEQKIEYNLDSMDQSFRKLILQHKLKQTIKNQSLKKVQRQHQQKFVNEGSYLYTKPVDKKHIVDIKNSKNQITKGIVIFKSNHKVNLGVKIFDYSVYSVFLISAYQIFSFFAKYIAYGQLLILKPIVFLPIFYISLYYILTIILSKEIKEITLLKQSNRVRVTFQQEENNIQCDIKSLYLLSQDQNSQIGNSLYQIIYQNEGGKKLKYIAHRNAAINFLLFQALLNKKVQKIQFLIN